MNKLEKIVMDIGFFFYTTAEGDVVAKVNEATKEISTMGITGFALDGSVLVVKLMRPGLLIGRKGVTIDALRKYIKHSTNGEVTDIRIEEDRLMPNLYAFQVALDDTIFNEG